MCLLNTKDCIGYLEDRIKNGCYFFPADKGNIDCVIRQLRLKKKGGVKTLISCIEYIPELTWEDEKIYSVLLGHVGEENSIKVDDIFAKLYPFNDINDAERSKIRISVNHLRRNKYPILSISSRNGGFFVAGSQGEFEDWARRRLQRARRIIAPIKYVREGVNDKLGVNIEQMTLEI